MVKMDRDEKIIVVLLIIVNLGLGIYVNWKRYQENERLRSIMECIDREAETGFQKMKMY